MRRMTVYSVFTFALGAIVFFYTSPVMAQSGASLAQVMKKANAGYAEAQYNLALAYEEGRGVKKNHGLAVRWYRRAAMQGLVQAQFNLGKMYKNGKGVARNYVEAYKWLSLATRGDVVPSARLLRDELKFRLTREERLEAEEWVLHWKPVLER